MYDVMAAPSLRARRSARRAAVGQRRVGLEPRPPPASSPGAEVAELLPALAGREPTGGYLFYDCQTDDARLVLTVLGRGRAVRRDLRQPRWR